MSEPKLMQDLNIPEVWEICVMIGVFIAICVCIGLCCCYCGKVCCWRKKRSLEPDHQNHAQRHHQSNNHPHNYDNSSNNVGLAVIQRNPAQLNSIQPAPYGKNPRLGKNFSFLLSKNETYFSNVFFNSTCKKKTDQLN